MISSVSKSQCVMTRAATKSCRITCASACAVRNISSAMLELDQGAVYIDVQNDEARRGRFVKPSIELPTGVELVSVDPEKVHLVVRKGKRRSAGRR